MRIFSKSTIKNFYEIHGDCKNQLLTWYKVTNKANWESFDDVKQFFNSVDCIHNNVFVFNIKGNNYRVVVDINFKLKWVFVLFIGTHAEYDKQKF